MLLTTFSPTESRVTNQMWSHVSIGMVMLAGGRAVLDSDGRLRMPLAPAVLTSLPYIYGIVNFFREMLLFHPQAGMSAFRFIELIHLFLFILIITLVAAASVAGRYSRPGVYSSGALVSPFALMAVGLIVVVHQHENRLVSMRFHLILGFTIFNVGVSQLVHIATHAQLGRSAPLARIARHLHGFWWFHSGLWILVMTGILYSNDGQGQHYLLDTEWLIDLTDEKHVNEIVLSIYAVLMMVSASVVASVPDADGPSEAGSGTRCSSIAGVAPDEEKLVTEELDP